MKITVVAKTRSKKQSVTELEPVNGQLCYSVAVHAAPADGKANEEIINLLSAHFGLAKSRVSLVSGAASRKKIFKIEK